MSSSADTASAAALMSLSDRPSDTSGRRAARARPMERSALRTSVSQTVGSGIMPRSAESLIALTP